VADASLRRSLTLWQVSLSGIGVILGAGLYGLIGPAAAQAGNALWLAFLLAGLTAGLTAYAYARLARLVAFLLCAWLLLHAGATNMPAAVGLALAGLAAAASGPMLATTCRRGIGERP
jgi:hypothetical protein